MLLVGSSGFERAIGQHLQACGLLPPAHLAADAGTVEQIVVMSGSCAPGTRDQIDYAIAQGFAGIPIDSVRLVDPATAGDEAARVTALALATLGEGRSPLLYSARGPDDPAIAATKTHLAGLGHDPRSVGHMLGAEQGKILRTILERSGIAPCVRSRRRHLWLCGAAARHLRPANRDPGRAGRAALPGQFG